MSKRGLKFKRDKRAKRKENNIILIICGGMTEVLYFKALNIELGEIRIKPINKPKNPTSIVEYGIKFLEDKEYRDIWCVFDWDNNADFDSAIELANRNGIKCAFSNEAFEYWYILHFNKTDKAIKRKDYGNILSGYLGKEYSKTNPNMYSILEPKLEEAIDNAMVIHQRHRRDGGSPSDWQSCTTVYQLVKELNKWKK